MNKLNKITVIFYEKPGCVGNQQQQDLLRQHGCHLEIKNLLSENWTISELRSYFSDKPIAKWFNQSAPAVKSGELNIHTIDEFQAIKMMLDDPILICRPLLKYGFFKQSGFNPGPVLACLNITLQPQQDLQSCPMGDEEELCEDIL
jgi:nitrogenase-associated protein